MKKAQFEAVQLGDIIHIKSTPGKLYRISAKSDEWLKIQMVGLRDIILGRTYGNTEFKIQKAEFNKIGYIKESY